jgi:DnaK suppressor protein
VACEISAQDIGSHSLGIDSKFTKRLFSHNMNCWSQSCSKSLSAGSNEIFPSQKGGILMLQALDPARERVYSDRLIKRRDRVTARVAQLHDESRALDANRLLVDEETYQRRNNLLGYLTRFHLTEIDQIDEALKRIANGKYGICFGCQKQIETEWLDSFPEAEFCSTCHVIKERMSAG